VACPNPLPAIRHCQVGIDGVLVFSAIEACSCAMLEIDCRAVAVAVAVAAVAAAGRDRVMS
jgi:hypothetical protein